MTQAAEAEPGEPPVDADPFEIPPVGAVPAQAAGVLCLHGLSGTPYEMRGVAEELSRRGLHCRGPVLPGHGGSKEALAESSHGDWIDAARVALARLRREFERVFVVGMSMGGLVSLVLAAEERPDGVVTIGAPLRLPMRYRWTIPLLKFVHPYRAEQDGSDIRDPVARARHPGIKNMPLASVHELIQLQRRVGASLSQITAPILVAHGALDLTADPKDARTIFASVNSGARELSLYARSGHVVPVDFDREALAGDIGDFVSLHCRRDR